MAGLTHGDIRMLLTMAKGTVNRVVFIGVFFHLVTYFFVTRNTEGSLSVNLVSDLQGMMHGMATKTVIGFLVLDMGLMTSQTVRFVAWHFMTKGTG